MTDSETSYKGHDDKEMFLRIWKSKTEQEKAIVIGIHGLGSHSGLLSFLGETFSKQGYTFYAPDMRAFGHYDGTKGHIESFDEYTEDIHALVHQIKSVNPSKKVFLFGHSMGGLHVIRYAAVYQDEVDGLITPCPAVSERLKIGSVTKAIARILAKANSMRYFDNGLVLDYLSRNEEFVERNRNDPLRFDKATPRFAIEGLKAREQASALGDKITLPIFVPQSGDDKILIPEENKEFFDSIASEDKTWKLYPDLYHEPWEEEGGDKMLEDILEWLDQHN
ncbi:MAG: alpha/beta fold hydrolase [Candidatus Lokiarchaeota archaeon]|nr:alpha/beta fold hydrolase [Candidatus Lokiarchaeota archaeon]